jgi:hypothetical protein
MLEKRTFVKVITIQRLLTMISLKLIYRHLFFLGGLVLFNGSVKAQYDEEQTWRDKVFFGGNFGLVVGNDVTSIEIAPLVGYRIVPSWAVGVGAKYQFYRGVLFLSGNYNTSIYGGSIFSNYAFMHNVIGNRTALLVHTEYEILNLERKYFDNELSSGGRFMLRSVLIGGGVREQLGERSSVNVLLLWALNRTSHSPYQNPTLRLNFIF